MGFDTELLNCMYKKYLSIAFLILGSFLAVPFAYAESLDIEQNTSDTTYTWGTATNGGNTRTLCQSFEPTVENISRIDFSLATLLSWTSSRDLGLYLTSGGCKGQGGETVLSSHILTESEYNAFNGSSPFDGNWYLDSVVTVTAGNTYYFSMRDEDACNLCYKSNDSSLDPYADGSERRGLWNDTFSDTTTRDLYFSTYYQDTVDITFSATSTDSNIGFSGTFFPNFGTVTSVEVTITGPNLAYYEWAFNPPNPSGTFDCSELGSCSTLAYPNGFYLLLATVCTTSGCSSVSDSVIVGGDTVLDVPVNYTPPLTIQEYDEYINSGGYIFSASTVEIVSDGGLIITDDGCAELVESASGVTQLVRCQVSRFEAIPPLSWLYGMYRAYGDAYLDASGTSSERIQLAIEAGIWGQQMEISFLDSATGSPVVNRVKEIFPNYYRVLVLLLWFNFVWANANKAWAVINTVPPNSATKDTTP